MTATALSIIHKVLKKEMFDLCSMIFSASPKDGPEIAKRLEELCTFLEQHAAHENERFAPVAAKSDPRIAASMQAEHEEQERALQTLRECAHSLTVDLASAEDILFDLGLDLSRFVGEMLLHLDREERAWKDALAPVMEGVEAIGTVAAIQPPEAQNDFLERIWPATTPGERQRIENAYQTAQEKAS